MRKLMTIALIICTMSLITPGCSKPLQEPSSTQGPQVGTLAPDFELQGLGGETVILSDWRGGPVMLNFWVSWSPKCRLEMPYIQEIYEGWTGKPPSVGVLTINVGESPAKVAEFRQSNNLSFPMLLDTQKTVALRYDITAYPVTLFIDKDGIIQEKRVDAFLSKEDIENSLRKIIP